MVKKVQKSALQGRDGVATTQKAVVNELGWLFREQPTDDFGIDAQVEVVNENVATGRLIALQIKSGASYFKKADPSGWWLGLDADDLAYWLEHSLPVIVIICDTDASVAYWQVVTPATISAGTKGGSRILIPSGNQLGASSRPALIRVAEGQPYELRIRQLRLALPWMHLLQSGRRILLEVDEWINKSSGRGDIQIASVDENNGDRRELGSWGIMVGLKPYSEVLPALVPWADVVHHDETYGSAEDSYLGYDSFMGGASCDWTGQLRPYKNLMDEVDRWRLELVLNDLGKGFLLVDEYAGKQTLVLTPPR